MKQQQKRHYLIIPLGIVVILMVISGLTATKAGESALLYRIDAPMHDRLFRLRNFVAAQPISNEVTLIGIDDYTVNKLGKFGSGSWIIRKPFIDQITYCHLVYQPAVIAYDIIFKETRMQDRKDTGDKQTTEADTALNDAVQVAEDAESVSQTGITKREIQEILEAIRKLGNDDITEIDINTLYDIAELTTVQGNFNLALALSSIAYDDSVDTTCIAAYEFDWRDTGNEVTGRRWTEEEIIGDGSGGEYSEDYGTKVPYLRDISIPMEHVHNLPPDFEFSINADLPSAIILDYVKLGYINVPRDEGGVVRRIPLVHGIEYEYTHPESGEFVKRQYFLPSMALLSCLYYWNVDLVKLNASGDFTINGKPAVEVHWGQHVVINRPVGDAVTIPIDKNGKFYLDFVGRVTDFNTVPFAEVGPYNLNPNAVELLKDKIALVGIMSTGASDVGPIPIDENTAFVHVHMVAISNILTETFIKPLSKSRRLQILLLLAMIIIPAAIMMRPLKFTYYTSLFAAVYAFILFYFILTHRFVLPVAGPALFLIGSYFFVIMYYYLSEEREKKKIRGMFSTMVSGDVLKYLEDNPESFSLAGQRAEATMFFSDVAGFTTISEALTPEKLVELLNEYLSPMTEIIMESNGFVDKYEGDAIMAEWGVPFPNPRHATLACWAALDQQVKLAELRPGFKADFGVDIVVRMGLNSGIVSAGNMGSNRHFSFTVMGDAVNQAARFEPANKDYGTDIMIGETTYELARNDIEARLLDKIIVKGKTVPIKIYELVARKGDISTERQNVLDLYDKALNLHWERKWDEALEDLAKALSICPDDGPSLNMVERITSYKKNPPPEEWMGEYIRKSKD